MTPADRLRQRVVTLVLAGILGLGVLLYAAIIALLWVEREIPGELWLAAGLFGGALVGLLNNSKGGSEGGHPVPLERAAPQGFLTDTPGGDL